ncbi:MAG: putative dehydrogenase protein [Tardiphaga sp.]|nr:putative dehydrogenase protein [Tardiphaga sp.]
MTHDELSTKSRQLSTGIPRVVIVGGGFAGLEAARHLAAARADVTLIDKKNHHCFQPLLYQVATASLASPDVAWPIRSILATQENVDVVMNEVTGIDRSQRVVSCRDGQRFPFDYLVIATGATHSYFGHPEWEQFAPGLKTIEDATQIRSRLLSAFEKAEAAALPAEKADLMTFVIIGGGPTGVEWQARSPILRATSSAVNFIISIRRRRESSLSRRARVCSALFRNGFPAMRPTCWRRWASRSLPATP